MPDLYQLMQHGGQGFSMFFLGSNNNFPFQEIQEISSLLLYGSFTWVMEKWDV